MPGSTRTARWTLGLVSCVGALMAFGQAAGRPQTPPGVESANELRPLRLEHVVPAVVGATVRATASGLPPRSRVTLAWATVEGGWVIEDGHRVRGKRYRDTSSMLGQFDVDARGRLRADFHIPEDYGGVHHVSALVGNRIVARAELAVAPTFELFPVSGPVGTPLELRVKGLDWLDPHSTWLATWDAHELGIITAAGTRGSAVARFRAAGPIGEHALELSPLTTGRTARASESSPATPPSRQRLAFRTTRGEVTSVTPEGYPPQWKDRTEVNVVGGMVTLEPSQGPVGTRAILRGEGFAPLQPFSLNWEPRAASLDPAGDAGSTRRTLEDIHADPDGRFDWPVTIPDDAGGAHSVVLREGAELVARTPFVIETSPAEMTPRSGPAGTSVTIRLTGVGWTDFDRTYAATYDNGPLGETRSGKDQGHAYITFTATGAPGPHLIDLYPGLSPRSATESSPWFRLPQLTYLSDHPGALLPALRVTFHISAR